MDDERWARSIALSGDANKGSQIGHASGPVTNNFYNGFVPSSGPGQILQLAGHTSANTAESVAIANSRGFSLSKSIVRNDVSPIRLIPYPPNRSFVGRNSLLIDLDAMFEVGSDFHVRVALHGLGGSGKSQIALQYAYRLQQRNPNMSVIWINASTRDTFYLGYLAIASKLAQLDPNETPEFKLSLIETWLADQANKWVMVVDNADDIKVFNATTTSPNLGVAQPLASAVPILENIPFNPSGKILFTTRSKETAIYLAGGGAILEVPSLDKEEATDLLTDRLGDVPQDQVKAKVLVSLLMYLPLAIVQAAAYIRARSITMEDYIQLFQQDDSTLQTLLDYDFGEFARSKESHNAVLKTWKLSFEQIQKSHPTAAALLSTLSFYDHQNIPRQLTCQEGQSLVDYLEAVGTLKAFSLITDSAHGQAINFHRLVQVCTRAWLSSTTDYSKRAGPALRLASRAFPGSEADSWDLCAQLLPHALAVLKIGSDYGSAKDRAALQAKVGSYLETQGQYSSAASWHRQTFELRKWDLGPDHTDTLRSSNQLAVSLWRCGYLEEAETLQRDTLARRESQLGKDNEDTLTSCGDLCDVLWELGKYKEAEQLNLRAVEGLRKSLGATNPRTLRRESNTIVFKWLHGEWRTALKTVEEYSARVRKVCGNTHPDTFDALQLQASLEEVMGKYQDAARIFQQVFDGRRKLLTEDHPDTIESLYRLGKIYEQQWNLESAEKLQRNSSERVEKVLGPTHPSCVSYLANLGLVLNKLSRFDEAEAVIVDAYDRVVKAFGRKSPCSLAIMVKLAVFSEANRNYDAAENTRREVLRGQEEVLGKKHPDSLISANNLALVLQNQRRYEEAEKMNRRVLQDQEEVLGKKHPYSLTSASNLALVLQNQRRYEEAEKMNRQVLQDREEVLGKKHLYSLTSASNLALVLQDQGRYEEAEELNRLVLKGRQEVLGAQHEDTLACFQNIATNLSCQDKLEDAERMQRTVLQDKEIFLGPQHLGTLMACWHLADSLYKLDNHKECLELFDRVAQGYKEQLKPDDPLLMSLLEDQKFVLQKDLQASQVSIDEN